jgi:glycosyltransferase involved in cell wall biosynthesis
LKTFTFSVLAFNHGEWILEHLESIGYLIKRYRPPVVDLIVSDDGSRDRTRSLIDEWLLANSDLFRGVTKLYNNENIGTVACVKNIVEACKTKVLKITAGDDVYSFEDIFYYSSRYNDASIVSGLPYMLINGSLKNDTISNVMHIASSLIYLERHRFDMPHATNAPNLLYNFPQLRETMKSPLLGNVKLVEDLAIQVVLTDNDYSFKQLYVAFVYYRRTLSSAYLIRGSQVDLDQKEIMRFQISRSSWLKKMLLKNRYFCYGIKNKVLKYLINLPFYIFLFKSLANASNIYQRLSSFTDARKLVLHQMHYRKIVESAGRCADAIE